jgi:hypothetical protein
MSEADLREEVVSPPAVLSEDRKRELLTFWRDALSGKIQPEVLRITPEIEAAVRADERRLTCRLSATGRNRLLTDYALSWHYGGHPVVCLESPAGCAVLAAGVAELLFFEETASCEQMNRVRIDYPGFWEEEMTK